MVLEALAALSLASSVLQLIDFASKLVSKGTRFYKSTDGVLDENAKLQAIAERMHQLSSGLVTSAGPFKSVGSPTAEELESPIAEEQALQRVAIECQEIAMEFSRVFDNLRVSGIRTKWKSCRQALKSIRSKEDIELLLERLRLAREELVVHLLVVLNNKQTSTKDCIIQSDKRIEKRILEAIKDSSISLKHEIATLSTRIHEVPDQERLNIIDAWRITHADQVIQVNARLSTIAEYESQEIITNLMLHSLYFPQIKERYERIPVAHTNTYTWVFDTTVDPSVPWTNFVEWLKDCDDPNGLYWVTGKAGSGKSTLMRYLCDDIRTRRYLACWADPFEPIITSYFFWNPGTKIQKSLTGLLQSLLHDILAHRQDLIKVASPWRWQSYGLGLQALNPWTSMELLRALRQIVEESLGSARFFFLMDGLDEFEGDDGARSDIIRLFQELARYKHIKICLSSRPWLIFEDAFDSLPSLSLQQLTYNDIRNYVQTELGENQMFKKLRRREHAGCSSLMSTIVEKAAGVFLWVYLVVRSLLQGLRDGDDIVELQQTLATIPADLEEYFAQMLHTLTPKYLEQATRLFQIALNAGPLTLLTYSFTQEKDPDFAIKVKVEPIVEEEIDSRHEWMRRRLNGRCKGLLEVYEEDGADHASLQFVVDFLHRTVKEFLETTAMPVMLSHYVDSSFDVDLELCKSYLAQLKSIEHYFYHIFEVPRPLLTKFLAHARNYEQSHGRPLTRLIDELDEAFKILGTQPNRQPQISRFKEYHWSNDGFLPEQCMERSFLTFAMAAGLHLYSREKLESNSSLVKQKQGRPLLDCALRPNWREESRIREHISQWQEKPDVRIVELMLAQGADPNEPYEGYTVWSLFLDLIQDNRESLKTSDKLIVWALTIELLIKGGASAQITSNTASGTSTNTTVRLTTTKPLEILRLIFNEDQISNFEKAFEKDSNRRLQEAPFEAGGISTQDGTKLSDGDSNIPDQISDLVTNIPYRRVAEASDIKKGVKRSRSVENNVFDKLSTVKIQRN